MSDYIKREDTIKAIESETYRHDYLDHVIDIIEDIPSADVVPVVRCKECKHCNTDWAMGKWYGSCKIWNTHSVMADWYCVNGERKDDETDRR